MMKMKDSAINLVMYNHGEESITCSYAQRQSSLCIILLLLMQHDFLDNMNRAAVYLLNEVQKSIKFFVL